MSKENEEEDVVESEKLSSRDKQEIEEGLCVNCAVFILMLAIAMLTVLVL